MIEFDTNNLKLKSFYISYPRESRKFIPYKITEIIPEELAPENAKLLEPKFTLDFRSPEILNFPFGFTNSQKSALQTRPLSGILLSISRNMLSHKKYTPCKNFIAGEYMSVGDRVEKSIDYQKCFFVNIQSSRELAAMSKLAKISQRSNSVVFRLDWADQAATSKNHGGQNHPGYLKNWMKID